MVYGLTEKLTPDTRGGASVRKQPAASNVAVAEPRQAGEMEKYGSKQKEK